MLFILLLLSNAYHHPDLYARFQFSPCLSRVDHIDMKMSPVCSKRLVDPIAGVICFFESQRNVSFIFFFKSAIKNQKQAGAELGQAHAKFD